MSFITIKVYHTDGKTLVNARGLVKNCVFKGEYKYQGMTYGVEFEMEHDIVPILGWENAHVGEECRQCGKRL